MVQATSHPKIRAEHLRRHAIVYVRQSSTHQVRTNRESTDRQYALVERAKSLGWSAKSVETIDEDQGRSGASSIHREGFKKLLAEIASGQVGVVLALEASRLARSSADWHRLVEICVVTQTLLADESALYDPRDSNDRLLLGVKGTISEAELFTLRCRLHEGRWNKARRGKLWVSMPIGYVHNESGDVVKEPDRQVQSRLAHIFRLFAQHKVARRVLRELIEKKLEIPTKTSRGPRHGEVRWKSPDYTDLIRILRNPTYAGAYAYGKFEYDSFNRSPTNGKAKVHPRPIDQWPVCLRDVYPAYITWEQFMENQEALRSNRYRQERRGAPRDGKALLQGIVFCGRCGARIHVQHYSRHEKRTPSYCCVYDYQHYDGEICQCVTSAGVDQAVTKLFLDALAPAKVEIALRALEGLEADREENRKQWDLQVERANYDVELARRRYEATDPGNRLVAGELEARWEETLRRRDQLQRDREEFERRQPTIVSETERKRIHDLSSDLANVWNAATTTMADRKSLLRFLIKRVHLDGATEKGKIRIDVEWHTGAHTKVTIDRPLNSGWTPTTPSESVARIKELLPQGDYTSIAIKLNEEGFRTAQGRSFDDKSVGHVVRSRGWNKNGKPAKPGKH
jgi:DNA invertase Pin-like site-specific DNA recombinase